MMLGQSVQLLIIFFFFPSPLGIDRYIVSTLEEIKDRLAALERSVANISRSNTTEITLPDDVSLPLQTFEEMDVLERRIEDRRCRKDLVLKTKLNV